MKEDWNRNSPIAQTTEAQRAIPSAMTELASTMGDLQTAVQALASRIAPMLPGGSPFDRPDKAAPLGQIGTPTPRPVRSHFCDELQARVYQLRELANDVQSMAKGVEV